VLPMMYTMPQELFCQYVTNISSGLLKRCLFIQNGSLASRSERKVRAVGAAHSPHLPLLMSAFGASSQSMHRLLRSPEHQLRNSRSVKNDSIYALPSMAEKRRTQRSQMKVLGVLLCATPISGEKK